jgi:hypothetical protein
MEPEELATTRVWLLDLECPISPLITHFFMHASRNWLALGSYACIEPSFAPRKI